jgi:hypothetical protein
LKPIWLLLLNITLLHPGTSNCQVYLRKPNESAEIFAKQFLPPNLGFCHKVIEYPFGNTRFGKNIIAFCRDTSDGNTEVMGFALLRTDSLNHFQKVSFEDTLDPGLNHSSRIRAIGFANADNDPELEIIIAIGQDIRLFDDSGEYATGIGEFWYTMVYDSEPQLRDGTLLLPNLFSFEGECTDIADTKAKLKSMKHQ